MVACMTGFAAFDAVVHSLCSLKARSEFSTTLKKFLKAAHFCPNQWWRRMVVQFVSDVCVPSAHSEATQQRLVYVRRCAPKALHFRAIAVVSQRGESEFFWSRKLSPLRIDCVLHPESPTQPPTAPSSSSFCFPRTPDGANGTQKNTSSKGVTHSPDACSHAALFPESYDSVVGGPREFGTRVTSTCPPEQNAVAKFFHTDRVRGSAGSVAGEYSKGLDTYFRSVLAVQPAAQCSSML